jgi:hypothetical protein
MSVHAMWTFAKRNLKLIRWVIGLTVSVLAGLWIAVFALSRAPVLRETLVETLEERLDADVELQGLEVKTFPLFRVHGDGLKLRLRGQQNPAPFIEVRHFEVAGGLLGMLKKERTFRSVELEGLRITIPPRTADDKEAGKKTAAEATGRVIIDRVTARDATLVIMPRNPAKEPKVWSIHNLDLTSVGFDRSMPFVATLTNPIPKGEIAATGSFGPWVKDDPGLTPVGGRYSFDRADLSTIDGIGGILSSKGVFDGILSRIHVNGNSTTPDFRIDVGGASLPLEAAFETIVDGTNGNTYLQKVDAKLRNTPIEASGAVASLPNVKGRTVTLDVKIRDGRIEDVLALAVRSSKPVMSGRIALQASLNLPPAKKPVADRLELKGRFALEQAGFSDAQVRQQLAELSRRARGKKAPASVGPVSSEMYGHFTMRDGQLRLQPVRFAVPGAEVELSGAYALRSEQLDFAGTLAMDAPVSEAMGGGIKGFFLKPFDPIFRKDGKGAVVPISITGPREQPKFGLQWSKVLKH